MRRFVAFGPAFVVLITTVVMLLVVPSMMRHHAVAKTGAQITLARQSIADDDILRRIDLAVTSIADAVLPSVVHVERNSRRASDSSGAGWVYDASGHVVTNAHVVRGGGRISVEFFDGRVCSAEVVGADPYTDIAVLRLECGGPFFPVELSDTTLPRVGERAYAFGSPFGFKFSMSEGIISGLGRETPGPLGGFTNYIQTDAAVNPGNSGGPLINASGRLMGMNVAIATARSNGGSLDEEDSGDSAGISFAIPLGTIQPIVSQILQHGSVERGFLGISFGGETNNDRGVRRFVDNDGALVSGIRVSDVTAGGPSARAGVQPGDVIVSIRETPVLGVSALRTMVSSTRPGESLDLVVWRDETYEDISVVLGQMPDNVLASMSRNQISFRLGMFVEPAAIDGGAERGVRVRWVFPDSPAAASGMAPGQVITSVAGRRVTNTNEFFGALDAEGVLQGSGVELGIRERTEDGVFQERLVELSLTP